MNYDSIAKKWDNVKGVSWKIVEKFADSNKKIKDLWCEEMQWELFEVKNQH